MNVTAIALIFVNTITICIPFLYFENLILLRNKFYLIKREKENRYELLAKGYDIVNSQGFEINNKIPLLSLQLLMKIGLIIEKIIRHIMISK